LWRYRSGKDATHRAGAATAAVIPGGPAFKADCGVATAEAPRMPLCPLALRPWCGAQT